MPFRMMEWNPKTPLHLQWDWDNLSLLTARAEAEISRSAQQSEWRVEGGGGIGNGSVHSYTGGGGGAGNCSGSELGNCSSRSSVSASIDSPAAKAGSCKISGSNFGAGKNKESTSPLVVASSEPLIGLKLGKRTYFEDFCANNSNSSPPLAPAPAPALALALVKNSRVSHRRMQSFHCQVHGCNIDLTPAKDYHRKHRVCESHSKCPKVIVAGLECRFCQQCSRFHELSKFDQKKRSCRRRLSDHNARRRKPQPEALSFNSSDYGQQMSFLLSQAPFGQVRTAASSSAYGFKLSQTKESWIKSPKLGDVDGQLHFPSTEQSKTISTAEVLNQGLEASVAASNFDGGPDLRRALSLLSTESWSSVDPGSTPIQHTNHPGVVRPALHTLDNTTDYWQDEHQVRVLSFDLHSDGSQFRELQLLKAPYEPALFDSSQMHRYPKSNGRALEYEA